MTCLTLRARASIRAHAPFARLREFLGAVARDARRYRELRRDRAAFGNLMRLDDHLLDDIGVSREEVEWAARLPLARNAARALRERALRRRSA